jgi:hypothetical protein
MKKYLIFLVFTLTACLQNTSQMNTVLSVSECKLPCWNGITPGNTTTDETKRILENTEGIGTNNVTTFYQLVEIHFSLFLEIPGVNKEILGEIFSDGKTVKKLLLFNNLRITFNDIVQEVGEPEYIVSVPFVGGGNNIHVIYPNHGVSFQVPYKSEVLEPETEVLTLMLFNPSDYQKLLSDGEFSYGGYTLEETQELMYLWKGYGNIQELYPLKIP